MRLPLISLGWLRRTKKTALDVTKKAAKKGGTK